MITVKIGKKDGMFRAVSEGHAQYNPGHDPVCAAVSAIMYALMGGIENQTDGGSKRFLVEPGLFDLCYIPHNTSDDATAEIIYNTAMIGIMQIQAAYPDCVYIEQTQTAANM